MFDYEQTGRMLKFTLSTDPGQIEQVVSMLVAFAGKHSRGDPDKIKMIARELLLNAVWHGNRNDPGKVIRCSCDILGVNGLRITIADEGEGFNYNAIMQAVYDNKEGQEPGGYSLLYALADTITFNEKGSAVTVICNSSLVPEEEILVEYAADRIVLVPRVEFTVVIAQNLRKLLVMLFDKEYRHYTLNLEQVKQVDSMCIAILLSFAKMVADTGSEYSLDIKGLSEDLYVLFVMMGFGQFYNMEQAPELHGGLPLES